MPLIACLLLLFAPYVALATTGIAILEIDGNGYQVNQAIRQLQLPDSIETRFYTLEDLQNDSARSFIADSSIVFVNVMMKELAEFMVNENLMDGRKIYALSQGSDPEKLARQGFLYDKGVKAYYDSQTVGNMVNMIRMMAHRHIDASIAYEKVVRQPEFCLHHPDAPGNFEDTKSYRQWYSTSHAYVPDHPWVGITMYGNTLKEGQVEAADQLIHRLEAAGFNVLPCFGPIKQVLPKYLLPEDGVPPIDLLLAFTMKFTSAINDEIRAQLQALNVPVFNVIRPYGETIEEWRRSPVGLGSMETVWAVATPEFSSGIEPSVLLGKVKRTDPESGKEISFFQTIDETIDFLLPRLQNWTALQRLANTDKKVAILYYNHSQGKQNIAAAYLNVFRSLENILQRMKKEGYSISDAEKLDEQKLQEMILQSGRNVGSWAPGELDALVSSGGVAQISLAEYNSWFNELPEDFRKPVLKQWGPPEKCSIMIRGGNMIFPMVQLGNVVLLPEPARGWSDDPMKLYHDTTLYPHHQYIAAYLWLRKVFHADAMIHLGTHATYEWLPGKQAGLAPSDPPEIMSGDIPNIYPYIVDDVGEGIQAKRRGRAMIVDHLTPPLAEADLHHEYKELNDLFDLYETAHRSGSETVTEYMKQIEDLLKKTGLASDLRFETVDEEAMQQIHLYLHEIDDNSLPYGLHTFGRPYDDDATEDMIPLIIKQNPQADEKEVRKNLGRSAAREMDNLIRGLAGEYIPAGEGNDPLRNLASIPTGKNFYGFSPAKVPSRAAWEIGKRAATQIIQQKLEKTKKYPSKVGIVLWATETTRNEGVNESTILYLLGVEPVWDPSGRVTGTRVIPGETLGRPRIDVLINPSGLYRDMFPGKLIFLDEAVQKALVQNDIDNYLAQNSATIRLSLLESGMSREEAEEQSRFRIFTEEVGSYGNGVDDMTSSSGLWDTDEDVSNVYLNRVQFAIGQGKWGVPMKKTFTENLRGVDITVHSRSTNVIGIIDTDDFFMYLGGMSLAVKNIKGEAPETLVTMHRRKDELQVEDVAKTIGREMRTRYLNPQWIEGMKKDNYGGARQMADFAENLWGWQVTVRDAVAADKWQQVFEVYVEDKYGMELADFFNQHNPWAYQGMTARMLEAVRKDYWQPDETVTRKLAVEYATSVIQKGVACCDHTCNNPMLNTMVMNIISLPGVMTPEMVNQFTIAIEKMARKSLSEQTTERKELLTTLGQAPGEKSSNAQQTTADNPSPENQIHGEKEAEVEGYRMEDMNSDAETSNLSSSGIQWMASLFVVLLVVLFYFGLRRKKMMDS